MTQNQILLHFRTAQIQITVFQAQVLIRIDIVLNIKRRSFGSIEYFQISGNHFDLAGSKIRVNSSCIAKTHFTCYFDNVFAANSFSSRKAIACIVRVNDNLNDTAAIAQIDENQPAVIAAFGNPTA